MDKNTALPKIGERQCPRCGVTFTCGIAAGDESCWCADLPNIIPLSGIIENGQTYTGCLCPDCLQMMIAHQRQSD